VRTSPRRRTGSIARRRSARTSDLAAHGSQRPRRRHQLDD
jgi:hypothetical protein